MTAASRLAFMHVVAALPAWMLADGEYGDIVVGRAAEFGFVLEADIVEMGAAARGLEQTGDGVPMTVASGPVLAPTPQAPSVIDTGEVQPILVGEEDIRAGTVVARGRLVVEPFLWATDGVLWPQVPHGVRLWSVDRIRRVGTNVADLKAVPPVTSVEHDVVYLLDLMRP